MNRNDQISHRAVSRLASESRPIRPSGWRTVLLLISIPLWSGCAALRPLDGLPARYLPDALKAPRRSGKKTIDLSLLRQTPPKEYRVDSGDVLGVYVLNLLGKLDDAPPVFFPTKEEVPPSLGYPIPVRSDGTLSVPLVPPIHVRGMTLHQVEDAIRQSLTVDRALLNKDNANVFVSLQKPRFCRVLVVRQETGSDTLSNTAGGQFNLGAVKRGTGKLVNLPAYQNDVLHALAETGGLPGLDAQNTIYVIRNGQRTRPSAVTQTRTSQSSPQPPALPMNPPPQPVSNPQQTDTTPSGSAATGPLQPAGFWSLGNCWGHSVTPTNFFDEFPEGPAAPPANWGHAPLPQPETSMFPSAPLPTDPGGLVPGQPQLPPSPSLTEVSACCRLGGTGYPQPSFSPSSAQGWGASPYAPVTGNWPNGFQWFGGAAGNGNTIENPRIIKIPIRLDPGQTVNFSQEDIILEDGDIVFIESRETEIFYTGGLLGGGQYTLPRDYDLDVLGAISIAQAQTLGIANGNSRGIGGPSALNQDISVSASHIIILRQLPNGSQVSIKVDLYQAMRDPNERILIQPGDYIILQYTPVEAIAAFFERYILEGAVFGVAASQINR